MNSVAIGNSQLIPGAVYSSFEYTGIVKRPMDRLVKANGIGAVEAADLAAGGNIIADIIEKESPGVVLWPERGSSGLASMSGTVLEERDAPLPTFVSVPLGTHTDIETHELSGLTDGQKVEVLRHTLRSLEEKGLYTRGETKLMLVDEVQKGGTLGKAVDFLQKVMHELGDSSILTVVAVQDERYTRQGLAHTAIFREIALGERPGVRTYTALVSSLFTMDVPLYLNAIASKGVKGSADSEGITERLQVVPNEEAHELFAALVRAYNRPEEAMRELQALKQMHLVEDLGACVLQHVLLELMTDPRKVEGRLWEWRIVGWWEKYLEHVLELRSAKVAATAAD